MTALVIVESPAKAKTIAGYLGDDYIVESSIGHVRDLPQGAADVPAAYKGESWARLGIDVDNGFKPLYVVNRDKKDQIRKLKSLLADADELYLATDEDREGEAIAWHLLEVLSPRVPVKRMVFHEITRDAILEAVASPRELDRRLVDAQEARRMLDRLYGYELSPVLWKKVMPKLSAGRVQSVATRIVVERERERMAFVAAGYWDLQARFSAQGQIPEGEPRDFRATLVELDGKRVASGRDFDQAGQLKADAVVIDQARSGALADSLADAAFSVRSVEPKPYRRRPAAPFMTSTFQQEAGRKLRLSSAMAMRAAQGLYEKGFITYMRTDSTTLSGAAVGAARAYVQERFGHDFLPDSPRLYTKKVKNAQEAHEAIRPAGDRFKSPDEVAREVPRSEAEVYELIFKRTVASQMTDAVGETVAVRLGARSSAGEDATFAASGTVITHQGFRRAYIEETDDPSEDDSADDRRLPPLAVGDGVDASDITAEGHETQPPARYTEASLVKRLEELGVGRPSTYASIMGTIQNRGYVWKKGS
ncbi:MAG: type I DNA topoisomerase, partial [Acidimicrobiia bacterium]|nr:type I DNA topoisomerase [Acidimicrobiia bacterium]